jgi:nitrite reductase/ring-hydroxylating ferredoxin subunit
MTTTARQERPRGREPQASAGGVVLIPVERYVSDEFAARERAALWPRVWQLACSTDHVAAPGDWYEYVVGNLSVLIVRGDDGELRAFQNVCRHRGSALCTGHGDGLAELRCPYHGWTWDLDGRLREVPSRRAFGVDNDDYGLFQVRVDTWGPFVFVNVAPDGPSLAEFLAPVPADSAWARIEEFRCTSCVTVAARCNWKTLIEGFSETYHVQGIHREMLAMADDVRGPQDIWGWHGKLHQSYGLASPRTRDVDDARVWAGFIEVMGTRIGIPTDTSPADAPAPPVPQGETMRSVIAERLRAHAATSGHDYSSFDDAQVLDLSQYNLFPNITVLVFCDMVTAVRARPGATTDTAFMDVFQCERFAPARPDSGPASDVTPARPLDVELPPCAETYMGLVLSQDIGNFDGAQRGLYQPGLAHLSVSATEECRVVNLHRNLERVLGIAPSELAGLDGFLAAFPNT